MPRRELDRLLDILEAIERIEQLAGVSLEDAEPTDPVWDAILYNLVVLGEAARAIPDDLRRRAKDVDWRGAVGMRNVITHEYFAVKRDIVFHTVRTELPACGKGSKGWFGSSAVSGSTDAAKGRIRLVGI